MNDQLLLVLFISAAVSLVAFVLCRMLLSRGDDEKKLRGRLQKSDGTALGSPQPVLPAAGGMRSMFERVGQAAAEPFMPKTREKQSSLRHSLARAGIYAPAAVKILTGAKVIFLALGLIGGYLAGMATGFLLLGLSVGGLVGYLAPTLWLNSRIKANQKALNYGLADALDLLVVCVEAGLTVDSSLQRVGQELALAHPPLARELGIAHMETRVGLSRGEALRNLGARTGNAALQSLASMLIQAERFGTSIATALRVHAETLRQSRQHAAEEMAAKASVKMTFPLVLFIFPATFIVLAGPTVIKMMDSPLFE